MKKFLTFMMLVLVGMTSQAQSGWSEPNGKYQAETVVYAVVDCGNYNELYNGNYVPEIAAFIDGEIRAYTTTYNVVGDNDLRLYTLRIGGVPGEDDNKVIDFKLYDLYRGLTYPLTPMYTTDDGIFPTEINWSGDNTLVQPSNYFTLSFKPVNEVKIYIEEVETDRFEMQVGQTRPMSHFHARLLDIEGNDATIPEEDGVFFIDGVKGTIAEKVTINGVDYVKAKACTSYSDEVGEYMYNVIGSYNLGKNFSFFIDLYAKIEPQYINVESIAIEDISTYFGEASISPTVVYNNGESEPTTPGVTYVSDNTNIVAVVKGELVPKGIGSATITATATDNTEVKTIFTMTVASALTKFVLSQTSADLYIGEQIDLPSPTFEWIKDTSGAPVINTQGLEVYTCTSSDSDIAEIRTTVSEAGTIYACIAKKRGTATITYTCPYDGSQVQFTVNVKQPIESVKILSVDGVEVPNSDVFIPTVDISLGEEITAVAQINPEDADYQTFKMYIINSDGMDISETSFVEVISSTIENNVLTYVFKILEQPLDRLTLCAKADEQYNAQVHLNIITNVTTIQLSETEKTVWFNDGLSTNFTVTATVLPENATNKNITITSSDENVVIVGEQANVFTVVGKGTSTLTFTSEANPDVKATCVVTTKKKVEYIALPDILNEKLYNDGKPVNLELLYYPTDADFNLDELEIGISETATIPEDWQIISFECDDEVAANGVVSYILKGECIWSWLPVIASYSADGQGNDEPLTAETAISVYEKMEVASGWSWISFTASFLFDIESYSNSIQEIRSQSELVYNDPLWGFFGTLNTMDFNNAYKINAKENFVLYLGEEMVFNYDGFVENKTLNKGWNWVSYPYEYKYAVADVFDATKLSEGDIILSQSRGFSMVTSEGTWEGSLTELYPYEGYLIYSNSEEITLEMPGRFELPQGSKVALANKQGVRDYVWTYDASQFANTMAIIGKIDIEDADDYSIGAFVGDDCRGEGKIINGRVYVTASGVAGERVSFRLYNKFTKEYYGVETEVPFAEIAGSYKEPIDFGVVLGTTNITDVDFIDENDIVAIYDMNGRRVTVMNEGIYILKIRQGNTITTKKVKK